MAVLRSFLVAILATLVVACASGPRVVSVSTTELSARLAERFPIDHRLLEVFDVHLSDPRVTALPDSNRIRADFRIQVRDRLGGKGLDLRLAVESGLRWNAGDRTVRLQQPEIDRVDSGGRDSPLLLRLGAVLLTRQFEDMVLYRVPAQYAAAFDSLAVTGLRVTASGLEVRLAPAAGL
jgi:hypothetical protein